MYVCMYVCMYACRYVGRVPKMGHDFNSPLNPKPQILEQQCRSSPESCLASASSTCTSGRLSSRFAVFRFRLQGCEFVLNKLRLYVVGVKRCVVKYAEGDGGLSRLRG